MPANEHWKVIQQTYQVPSGASKAKIDLIYRWNEQGTVYFGGTSLKETDAIKPRMVRLASIHHRPTQTASSKENLEQFKGFIEMAGNQGILLRWSGPGIKGNQWLSDKPQTRRGQPSPSITRKTPMFCCLICMSRRNSTFSVKYAAVTTTASRCST